MQHHNFKTLSVYAIATLLLASCANTNTKPSSPGDTATSPTTLDSPLSPVSSTPLQASTSKTPTHTIKEVPSIIDKMAAHSRTLYWGTKDSYTYYHGGVLEAEYKPGKGITLREDKEENAIECHFNEAGNLSLNSSDSPGLKKKCSQLMFTFDEQISE